MFASRSDRSAPPIPVEWILANAALQDRIDVRILSLSTAYQSHVDELNDLLRRGLVTEAEYAARMSVLVPANEEVDLVDEAAALFEKGKLTREEYDYRLAILRQRPSRVGRVIVNSLLGCVVILGILGIVAAVLIATVASGA